MELLKKEVSKVSKRIEELKLYRKDIEKFIRLSSGDNHKVIIYDSSYKYSDLDDYEKNNGKKIKKLNIVFVYDEEKDEDEYEMGVISTLELDGHELVLTYYVKYVDLSDLVEEYQGKKTVITKLLYYENIIYFISIYVIYGVIKGIQHYDPETFWGNSNEVSPEFGLTLLMMISSLLIFLGIGWLYRKYYLGFYLEKEHDTIFKRNRKEILKAVVLIIIGGLLTKLIDWIF